MSYLILLGLLQALLLPGLCIVLFVRERIPTINVNLFEIIFLSVVWSAFINYWLVWALYLLDAYSQSLLFLIIFMEGITLYFFKGQIASSLVKARKEFLHTLFSVSSPRKNWFSLICIGYPIIYFLLYKSYLLTVFTGWDVIASWNRWAVEFYSGNFGFSFGYPQGLPILLSLVYKIADETNIQLFSKWICWIWPLVGGGLLLSCAYRAPRYRPEFTLGAFLYLYLQEKAISQDFMFSGFVDPFLAVYGAFWLYANLFYLNVVFDRAEFEINSKTFLFFAVALAGASFFKITGLWLVATFGLLPFVLQILYKKSFRVSLSYIFSITLVSAIALSWYLWVFFYPNDFPIATYNSLLDPRIWMRPIIYGEHLWHVFGLSIFLLIVVSLIFSNLSRLIFFINLLPLFIFSACIASYDLRVIYILFAPASLMCTIGFFVVIKLVMRIFEYAGPIINMNSVLAERNEHILNRVVLIVCVFIGGFLLLIPDKKITSYNTYLRVMANDFGGNKRLLAIFEEEPNAKILSCWQLPSNLPGAYGRYISSGDCSQKLVDLWVDSQSIKYFLYWDSTHPQNRAPSEQIVREQLNQKVKILHEERLADGYILFYR
jgi:hypothetical protein